MAVKCLFHGKMPKQDEDIIDCQDNYKVIDNCFAIADGVSQSFYPNVWSEMLVANFCDNPEIGDENWQQWLSPIQKQWLSKIQEKVGKAKNEPIWVTNQNRLTFLESAASTFIGLEFIEKEKKIKLTIIGDSCLFILHDKQLIKSYLIDKSTSFDDSPSYLASYAKDNKFKPDFFTIPLETEGVEIYFILATDALAQFIFENIEQKKDIFSELLKISSSDEFENFVEMARKPNDIQMKNDDVTLVIIKAFNNGIIKTSTDKLLHDSNRVASNQINKLQEENRHLRRLCSLLLILSTISTLGLLNYLIPTIRDKLNTEAPKAFNTPSSNIVASTGTSWFKQESIIFRDQSQKHLVDSRVLITKYDYKNFEKLNGKMFDRFDSSILNWQKSNFGEYIITK